MRCLAAQVHSKFIPNIAGAERDTLAFLKSYDGASRRTCVPTPNICHEVANVEARTGEPKR